MIKLGSVVRGQGADRPLRRWRAFQRSSAPRPLTTDPLVVLALILFVSALPARAQEGSSIPRDVRGTEQAIARGILDGNLIETNFRNYTEFAQYTDVPWGVWPRGTGSRHIDGIGMSVSGQVIGERAKWPQFYGGRPDTVLNPISIHYWDAKVLGPNGELWTWLPLPGFHNTLRFNPVTGERDPTPALSDDPDSWLDYWPDKLNDPDDPGWRNDAVDRDPMKAAWNGFFGKGIRNADLESYYVIDDLSAKDYHINPVTGRPFSQYGIFYPDPSDSTMGGLGLQVSVRVFQWANVLAEDAMFIVYRLTNIGRTNYGDVLNLPCFQGEDSFGRRVYSNPCPTGLHLTQFTDYGMGWEEFDEASAYDPQLDIAYGWDNDGIGTRPGGGNYRLGVTGFAFLESPVRRDDGVDNDEDGATDEGRFSGPGVLIEGQDAIRGYVEASYHIANLERALGSLADQRAFAAARWWTGDEDLDWLTFDDKNQNGELDQDELINDDLGRDGLGPNDIGYPGPDTGESDGQPSPGEPNFDQTDIEESDQIGLTGIHLSNVPLYREGAPMTDDAWMWERIVENQFPVGTKPHRQAADVQPWITWNSGPIKLAPNGTDFFSTAWLFGWDEADFLNNRRVVQTIYNADYRFAQPPIIPTLTARAGDGHVVLSWNSISIDSYDRFTQEFDFEGYKLYRGMDPLLSDARVISDFRGVPTLYRPLAQWDVKNGLTGNRTVLQGQAVYGLGDDSGLEFAYIDRDVTNGKTYYYALVAYDRGFQPAADSAAAADPNATAIDPQENTFNISIDAGGVVRGHSVNVAIVTPRSRAAGYVETSTSESLDAPHGSLLHDAPLGTGSIGVNVVNEAQLPEGAVFRVAFHDTAATGGSTYETSAFSLENLTTGEVLLDRQEMGASSPSTAGLVIDFFNDELDLDLARSGWMGTDGTGSAAISNDPSEVGLSTTWRTQIEIDPTTLAKVTSHEYELTWVDPADSVFTTPRFSSDYPILDIPVFCRNTTLDQPCDLLVDDLNADGAFGVEDALIIAEKDCRFCVHGFRFQTTFSEAPGAGSVPPEPGSRIAVSQIRPFAEGDYFEFTMLPAHVDPELARSELEQVAVVPNPYVAAAAWEPQTQITGRGPRQVQFIHLPEACTIRIFSMRGEMVQEIEHRSTSGEGAAWWDLKSRDGQEVAYGVYLYHVEAPGVGETSGKFAIVK